MLRRMTASLASHLPCAEVLRAITTSSKVPVRLTTNPLGELERIRKLDDSVELCEHKAFMSHYW
jgi:hypothetical protein